MNNTIGERCETTLEFQKLLEKKFNIEVILQDERLTTVEATNYMIAADISRKKRKKKVDALAANIILQTYLDKERGGKI
jgi:putative Holliday junction resolvase